MEILSNNQVANSSDTQTEGAAFIEATREQLAAYVPSPEAQEYDGPRDRDGEPFGSCFRRWQKSREHVFARVDLSVLEGRNEAPKPFEDATRLLVNLCLSPETMYGNSNPDFGRFSFSEAEATARQMRAMLRLLRGALDFLEEDYLSCEEEEREHLRARLAAFEQLQGATVAA
jgi:hypothetical protein